MQDVFLIQALYLSFVQFGVILLNFKKKFRAWLRLANYGRLPQHF